MSGFLSRSEDALNKTLGKLGWTQQSLEQNELLSVQCPFNSGHWLPQSSVSNHVIHCSLRSKGYTKAHIESMPTDRTTSGLEELSRLRQSTLAGNFFELDCNAFSTAEQKKIRMVEYAAPEPSNDSMHTLAQLRDAKRRRRKYRGVHTARRSYIEILREIIAQQTEFLTQAAHPVVVTEEPTSGTSPPAEASADSRPRNCRSTARNRRDTSNSPRAHRASRSSHDYSSRRTDSDRRSSKRPHRQSSDRRSPVGGRSTVDVGVRTSKHKKKRHRKHHESPFKN